MPICENVKIPTRFPRVPLVSSVGSSKIRDSVTALGSVGGDEDVPRVARPKFRFR
jgi:hypothetical protein